MQVYLILDEFILGGEFEETSKKVRQMLVLYQGPGLVFAERLLVIVMARYMDAKAACVVHSEDACNCVQHCKKMCVQSRL